MAKWVYLFSEGNASMRELLGGKGANLAEMTGLGLPVPQGFTITTEACTQYYEDGREIFALYSALNCPASSFKSSAVRSTSKVTPFFSFIASMSCSKYFLPTSITTSEYIWINLR